MRVLVAGGAGFVGSHVCRALLDGGHSVVCLDNLSTGSAANVAELFDDSHFELVEADVASAPFIEIDAVMHLASPASPVDYDRMPLETMAANSLGTWRLLEVAKHAGATLL